MRRNDGSDFLLTSQKGGRLDRSQFFRRLRAIAGNEREARKFGDGRQRGHSWWNLTPVWGPGTPAAHRRVRSEFATDRVTHAVQYDDVPFKVGSKLGPLSCKENSKRNNTRVRPGVRFVLSDPEVSAIGMRLRYLLAEQTCS
jgi:hypothetical protein